MRLKDWYCNKCSLQFNKKSGFDIHVSTVDNQKVDKEQKMIIYNREPKKALGKELFQYDVCDVQMKTKLSEQK